MNRNMNMHPNMNGYTGNPNMKRMNNMGSQGSCAHNHNANTCTDCQKPNSCQESKMPGNRQESTITNIPSRCALLNSIYEIGFSLDDMILYLDTHPRDTAALNYYHKLREEYMELVKVYTRTYGPLRAKDVHNEKYFSWINSPMPWEGDV